MLSICILELRPGSLVSAGLAGPRQLLEVHQFLVYHENGCPVLGEEHRRLYDCVRAFLLGAQY